MLKKMEVADNGNINYRKSNRKKEKISKKI